MNQCSTEPKKLYTSLGTGFPPAGCKHGEGVEVGKRRKTYIVYTQTFLKTDQILRKITLGSIKACIVTNFLRSLFNTWTILTFPKIPGDGTMSTDVQKDWSALVSLKTPIPRLARFHLQNHSIFHFSLCDTPSPSLPLPHPTFHSS